MKSLLVIMVLAGCSIEHATDQLACTVQSDCETGRTCTNGYCVIGGANNGCPGDCTTCDLTAKTCSLAGNGANKVTCPTGYHCTITCGNNGCRDVDCEGAASCDINCSGGASCDSVKCGAGACTVACTGDNSCGNIDCRDSCACDVTCTGGGCDQARCPDGCTSGDGCSSQAATCDSCT